jgi:hypothetical protein
LFGRPPRESACECERAATLMLAPVLNLVNGPVVANAVKDPANRIARLVATEKDDARVVDDIFMSILSRPPTKTELVLGMKSLRGDKEEFAQLQQEYRKRLAELDAYEKQLPARQAAWEAKFGKSATWTVLDTPGGSTNGGAVLTRQPDGSLFVSGKNSTPETYIVRTATPLQGITAVRLEVLPDSRLPANGPGRAPNGNFVLNELRLTALEQGIKAKPQRVAFKRAVADFSQVDWSIAGAIDNNPGTGWAILPQSGRPHTAYFELKKPITFAKGAALTFTLDQRFPGRDHNIGRFRLSVTTDQQPVPEQIAPQSIAKLLAIGAAKRTQQQKKELENYFRSIDTELARLKQAAAELSVPSDPRLLGAQDLAWALINSKAFLFNH